MLIQKYIFQNNEKKLFEPKIYFYYHHLKINFHIKIDNIYI